MGREAKRNRGEGCADGVSDFSRGAKGGVVPSEADRERDSVFPPVGSGSRPDRFRGGSGRGTFALAVPGSSPWIMWVTTNTSTIIVTVIGLALVVLAGLGRGPVSRAGRAI